MMLTPNEALASALHSVFPRGCWDDSLEETVRRVLGYWREYLPLDQLPFRLTTFPSDVEQIIIVTDIEFSSICSHHLLPIIGTACVGYLPGKTMIGLSKIPRIVDFFAKQPQVQERLTAQIAEFLMEELSPIGVGVVIKATHTCMACRGVLKHNGKMVTSEMRGLFREDHNARAEFFQLIG